MTRKPQMKQGIPPLARKAEKALKEAVREVILDHQRRGYPVVIWRKGRVVQVPARQLLRRKKVA